MAETRIRRRYVFSGLVQGVGFHYRARHAAELYGVSGWVHNDLSGTVTMELQGGAAAIEAVLEAIERGRYVRVEDVSVRSLPLVAEERGFVVR